MQDVLATIISVHGFVLAGGKSLRMGQDKAMLPFCGRPMIEVAVEKLRKICAAVSIAGNRQDLSAFAPVVRETRFEAGPAAGIEAGLNECREPWAMFIPLDVPIIPAWLLRVWVQDVIEGESSGSYLVAEGRPEPAFCILRREVLPMWTEMLDRGERGLEHLLGRVQAPGRHAASGVMVAEYAPRTTSLQMKLWFSNVNTPQELAKTEHLAETKL